MPWVRANHDSPLHKKHRIGPTGTAPLRLGFPERAIDPTPRLSIDSVPNMLGEAMVEEAPTIRPTTPPPVLAVDASRNVGWGLPHQKKMTYVNQGFHALGIGGASPTTYRFV